jgi:hypothetical protein
VAIVDDDIEHMFWTVAVQAKALMSLGTRALEVLTMLAPWSEVPWDHFVLRSWIDTATLFLDRCPSTATKDSAVALCTVCQLALHTSVGSGSSDRGRWLQTLHNLLQSLACAAPGHEESEWERLVVAGKGLHYLISVGVSTVLLLSGDTGIVECVSPLGGADVAHMKAILNTFVSMAEPFKGFAAIANLWVQIGALQSGGLDKMRRMVARHGGKCSVVGVSTCARRHAGMCSV